MLLNMADENKSGAPAEDEKLIETTETEEKIKEASLEANLVDNASSEEDDENKFTENVP